VLRASRDKSRHNPRVDDIERRYWRHTAFAAAAPLVPGVAGLCDMWVGAKNLGRYGNKTPVMCVGKRPYRRTLYPHVWAWERIHGPRPAGSQLSPTCGQSLCVKPEHRELRPRGAHRRHSEPANAS